MKRILSIALIGAALTACTIEQQQGELQSEFHPPLVYAEWKTEQYKASSGQQVCVVTSGRNGLSVLLRSKEDGTVGVSARGERMPVPGMNFTVNVSDNHYRTSQEYFSPNDAITLADDLSRGGKAYLRWSEVHGGSRGRLNTTNILRLDGFKERFEQCRQTLLAEKKL